MTLIGALQSQDDVNIVCDENGAEATGQSTTSATLADITGCTCTVTIPTGRTGRIHAIMTIQASTTGGSPATGGWAVNINGADKTESQRYLSGANDRGLGAVSGRTSGLSAGTYTVKGRHRRASGSSTVNTGVATLHAVAYLD